MDEEKKSELWYTVVVGDRRLSMKEKWLLLAVAVFAVVFAVAVSSVFRMFF